MNRAERHRRIGTIGMITGAMLLAAALSLLLFNQWEDNRARQSGEQAVSVIQKAIRRGKPPAKTLRINGDDYIGYLALPTVSLELPVQKSWSYPRLRRSPCRYAGSPESGGFVVAAHNYQSHFGKLSRLQQGDRITFTAISGKTTAYTVAEVEVLAPTAIEAMISGEWDLTLFTCTYGGQSRVTVRCLKDE
jgi:sortase A